ncbi:hypothetical protein EHQ23_08280 [Leptospira bourretii]|uniref:Uncharacterized protein n=2 Tax=Leptospira TaxID=171 RepID=A0A4V3JL60_9LEPT|nr:MULTISPECIES: hypothetical protein [Leptospira]PKA23659.1 hypothetical protein CH381_24475 [Leptospira sp. mixed culture ATI2-C-A1]MCG6140886.1 hypothetical protein [Leptospira mtsangambouensis]MCW7490046.1 hypothetical protein [Leptospira meyeri]PJZ82533.1 hypothetical protein CH359_00755 [Leptospira meyeri]PJZ98224.1 hypothetical protein CH358_04620 [Leptospira meyeri]
MSQFSIFGNLAETEEFGPDPVLLRKRGMASTIQKKFENYKKKIDDPAYMDYAINKIAMEISHFISK